MSASKYEVFLKTAELGGLTRAAEYFGYTQSNVSHIINSLEKEFGFRLFNRSRAGAKLTKEGEKILPAVRAVVSGEEMLRQVILEIQGLAAIRVAAFTSVAVHWLPGIIKDFQQDRPGVEFKLLNGDYHDVGQWLSGGEVDIGFITLPTELSCRSIPLCEDRLLAVLPPEHPKSSLERLPVEQVAGEPFIGLLETSDQDSRRPLEAAGVSPSMKFTTKDDYAIIAMVANGLGMSIMPELLLEGHAEKVRVMELDPPAHRTIALALPETSAQNALIEEFADFVQKWVKEKRLT